VYELAVTEQVLESSSVSADGVNVPVHVVPLCSDMAASEPLAHVTSLSLANPATVSEKTIVSVDVSPVFRAVSLIVILLTEGAWVSTA
jgi:hypothetical protein